MKKNCIYAIILLSFLTLFSGCGKKPEEIRNDRSGYEKSEFQSVSLTAGIESFTVRPDGTLLCSSADARLYTYGQDGTGTGELASDSFYGNLCADGEKIYAFDYEQSAVVELGENGVRVIQNTILFHTIRNMVAVNGKIYVLAIPVTRENSDGMFPFGAEEFEDYGEQVYCIDAESGQYGTLGLAHIAAEYRAEDGSLYFYGWQEDKYYLYRYDTEKEKIVSTLHFGGMGNVLSIVVEGGQLFALTSTEGLIGIDLTTGEKEELLAGWFTMFGNDLQFYRGNLFVNNMAAKEIQQLLYLGVDGRVAVLQEESEKNSSIFGQGEGSKEAGNGDGGDEKAKPTEWPKHGETIGLSTLSKYEIDTQKIKSISGFKTKLLDLPFGAETFAAELMAGNPEVDIYVVHTSSPVIQRIRELGLYVPLNDSEIITEHLSKCFGYVQEAAINENGDIWMIPLDEIATVTWYIPENMERFHVTAEDLGMLDDYMAVLERLHGKTGAYRYYNNAAQFILWSDAHYDVNYNNFQAGVVNFDTELYRHVADTLWSGWVRHSSATANHPLFFSKYQESEPDYALIGEGPEFNRNIMIFKTCYTSEHLFPYGRTRQQTTRLLNGWRVMAAPRLADASEKNYLGISYAFVNPYSRQKEAAIEYLEVLAVNQSTVIEWPSFFREDIEYYEDMYDTSLPAFQDLYGIFRDSVIPAGYPQDSSDEYITEYQQGLITFDEAIRRRQRAAEMGLYE